VRFLAIVLPLMLLAAACGSDTEVVGDGLCREIASDVGLEFDNPYGRVVAEEDIGRIMQRNMGNGAAVGDYDEDGDLDVYVLGQEGTSSRLFRNELAERGTARFTDVTSAAGVGDRGLGRATHFADLDGDGLLDLLVLNDTDRAGVLSPSRIFRNDGDGSFTDVTAGSGFDPSGYLVGGAALADFDADDDLDLYLSYWTRELGRTPVGQEPMGLWPGSNRLYENLGDFQFRNATAEFGLDGIHMDTFSAVPHDFDADGDLDLYLTVDHREDRYFENIGGEFVDLSVAAGVFHRGNDMGVALADVDGSGTLDLFVTNIFDSQQSYGVNPPGNTLLLVDNSSAGLRFIDDADDRGVLETAWSWGAAFVDIDLDADLDLFVVQGFDEFIADHFDLDDASSSMLINDGGHFTPVTGSGCDIGGDQRALVPFDYDRDGDADFLVTQIDQPLLLLENLSEGATLTVALDPDDPASSGAVVTVQAGERTTSQVLLDGGSYLAGPPAEAYFGLGGASEADVTVRWPDGSTREFEQIPADTILSVTRERG